MSKHFNKIPQEIINLANQVPKSKVAQAFRVSDFYSSNINFVMQHQNLSFPKAVELLDRMFDLTSIYTEQLEEKSKQMEYRQLIQSIKEGDYVISGKKYEFCELPAELTDFVDLLDDNELSQFYKHVKLTGKKHIAEQRKVEGQGITIDEVHWVEKQTGYTIWYGSAEKVDGSTKTITLQSIWLFLTKEKLYEYVCELASLEMKFEPIHAPESEKKEEATVMVGTLKMTQEEYDNLPF
ncbi:hypothetical protein [Brevibacillus borstelensis]|uniref:hypothetical protein n=1 Tax=Brevibacillus borstelensis TaxID=45462 RepID=UPI00203F139F|nr:hypothetical protein [Brevibacillus borstelensis]MCM3473695.1 hypothetical protein [Brevibacillus borstelensis]MED1854950.1 hypothetical protein [Brevibacillus borstelensis]